jgi:zinc transport system substrate-binding protein
MDGLVQADPAGADIYRQNAAKLIRDLNDLHRRFRAGLGECEIKTIVVSHEAYSHLALRYGLSQLGLTGSTPEAESQPRSVAEIATKMRELDIRNILVEPILSEKLAEAVAKETGATLLPLHPLETLTAAQKDAGDDYFTVMERNLETLQIALRCK